MSEGRQTGSFGDELTNLAMIGLVVLFGVALVLRGAGSIAAFLTGTAQPAAGPASGVGVLFRPGDPGAALEAAGLNPVVYWIVAMLLLAGLVTAGVWGGLGCGDTSAGSRPTRDGSRGRRRSTRSPRPRPVLRC